MLRLVPCIGMRRYTMGFHFHSDIHYAAHLRISIVKDKRLVCQSGPMYGPDRESN